MGGISIWQLVIIAVIVVLLFGTKKLRGIGGDLGGAIKGFKKAMSEEGKTKEQDKEKIDNTDKTDTHHQKSSEKTTEKDNT